MKKDVKFSTRMASTDREAIKELAKQLCFYAERQQKRQTVQLHCLPNPRTRFKVPLSGVAEACLFFLEVTPGFESPQGNFASC